jgi:hypothetical protein
MSVLPEMVVGMVTTKHEAPLDLAKKNPYLIVSLLRASGIAVPDSAVATISDTALGTCDPKELRGDAVIVLQGPTGKVAAVLESQTDPPKPHKRRKWPCYVAIAASDHDCDTVLLVVTGRRDTADACRAPVRTGHPGFDLTPIVIGPTNTPDPDDPANGACVRELTVLAALTHALDLDDPATREHVMRQLVGTDPDTLYTYTYYIHAAASATAKKALEELMTRNVEFPWADQFINQGKLEGLNLGRAEGKLEGRAEGKLEGKASAVLRVLERRGFHISEESRHHIRTCRDNDRIDTWFDTVCTADDPHRPDARAWVTCDGHELTFTGEPGDR